MKLSELLTFYYGKNKHIVECKSSSIPIYGTGGIIGWSSKPIFGGPSILFGRKGSIEHVIFVNKPFWTIDTMFYTKINSSIVNPKYLFYKLSCIDLSFFDEGTTIPSLRIPTLSAVELTIDSPEMQQHIVDTIGSVDGLIENESSIIHKEYELAKYFFVKISSVSTVIRLSNHIWFSKGKVAVQNGQSKKNKYLNMDYLYGESKPKLSFGGVSCQKDDCLMLMDGASSGMTFIGYEGYIGSTLAIINHDDVINSFVLYVLLKQNGSMIKERLTGSAIPHADKHIVEGLDYPVLGVGSIATIETLIRAILSSREKLELLKKTKEILLSKYF